MNENKCFCCGEGIPEGYLICPRCAKDEEKQMRSGQQFSGRTLAMAYREHDRALCALRERDLAIRRKDLVQNERLKLLRRIKTYEASFVFRPLPGAREAAKQEIARKIGEALLAAGLIQWTESEDVIAGDSSVMILHGRVRVLQPGVEP